MNKKREKNKTVRNVIAFVSNKEFTGTVLNIIKDFIDDYYRKIFRRLSAEIDIVTLNARYHKKCYNALFF